MKKIYWVLGFKNTKENFKIILQRVPDVYKKSLKDINKNRLGSESLPNPNYHEGKSIYSTEWDIYYLIFRSQTKDF